MCESFWENQSLLQCNEIYKSYPIDRYEHYTYKYIRFSPADTSALITLVFKNYKHFILIIKKAT